VTASRTRREGLKAHGAQSKERLGSCAPYAARPPLGLGDGLFQIWVREDSLVEGILSFFSERVFGPNRRELLKVHLDRMRSESDRGVRARIKSLEKVGQATGALRPGSCTVSSATTTRAERCSARSGTE